ncbi:UNVERIFIED_CONTAM: hypothetical protein FKN15_017539 [Acipenser sinensis]
MLLVAWCTSRRDNARSINSGSGAGPSDACSGQLGSGGAGPSAVRRRSTNPSPLGPQIGPPIRHPTGSRKGRGSSHSTAPSHSPAHKLRPLSPRRSAPPSQAWKQHRFPRLSMRTVTPPPPFASVQMVPPFARPPLRQGTSLDPHGPQGGPSRLPSHRVQNGSGLQQIHWSISPRCSCLTLRF